MGVSNLSDIELLAVILGSGTKKQNVINLSKKILKSYSLKELADISESKLAKVPGIGPVRAAKIIASLELGKRSVGLEMAISIDSPKSAISQLTDIRSKSREYLIGLYLNARNELIQRQVLTIGTLNQNVIEPRDVFSHALTSPCAAIILAHNHPSGDPKPSSDDKKFTDKMSEGAQLMGVELVDHIIVTSKDYFSFKEAGLL